MTGTIILLTGTAFIGLAVIEMIVAHLCACVSGYASND